MRVKAKCPASCGELLQGMIGNGEKLISYSIDIYSEVTIEEKKNPERNLFRRKATEAMYKTLAYYGEPAAIGDAFSIEIRSHIPLAKGMASSTADIAATAVATALLLGKKLTGDQLARICASIEPTDSTIFKNFTLFDHLQGIRMESFHWHPDLDVLVLEPERTVDTQIFRMRDYTKERLEAQPKVEEALRIFRESVEKQDLSLLGKAATMSALANQKILPKEKLEEIIDISQKTGCLGVNVAHSGTVVGILLEKDKADREDLRQLLKARGVFRYYNKAYFARMIQGGVDILEF